MDRIKKLQEFLQKEPHDPFILHAMALEYIKLGVDSIARGLLEEALEKDPASMGAYYQLGKLLERAGETTLALQWYEKGMAAARVAGEKRAYNELQSAYDDLAD
jgi:Tfp pilus assembly protein PilF